MVPWVHLNIRADGKVCHCCRATPDQAVGSVRESALAQIWNAPGLRAIRANMLEERPSPECRNCQILEAAGCSSPRLAQNQEYARHFRVVETTSPDGSVATFQMPFMDIRFSNICNFACIYCDTDRSSAWSSEHKGPGRGDGVGGSAVLTATRDSRDLWRQVEPLIPHVEHFYFAGGEPLLCEEHYRILNRLVELGKSDVILSYSTNFSETTFRGLDVMRLWDKFNRVDIAASLDASGRRGEYIRINQDWGEVLRNRQRMFAACPKVSFTIAPTLTAMNALHLPDFHREWLEIGYLKPPDIYLNILLEPSEYSVQILPEHLKRRVADRYGAHAEFLVERYGEEAAAVADQFRGAVKFMMAQDAGHLLDKFRQRIHALDRRRNSRFSDVFPELAELLTG